MIDRENLIANWDTLNSKTKKQILELANTGHTEMSYFIPEDEEKYYIYTFSCKCEATVTIRIWHSTELDIAYLNIGNCFKTRGEALFAGNHNYFTRRFETYVTRHSEKLDWNNEEQRKYYTFYSFTHNTIYFNTCYFDKLQGAIYASSEQILKDAIVDIGEVNFLKYVLRVKE